MTLDMSNPLVVFAILVFTAGLSALAFFGFKKWNEAMIAKGTHPSLQFLVHQAIVLAYKSSDTVFDVLEERLYSIQKREIAGAIYDILDEEIKVSFLPFKIQWKKFVTKEQFMDFVAREYDRLAEGFSYVRNTILDEMIESMTELEVKQV